MNYQATIMMFLGLYVAAFIYQDHISSRMPEFWVNNERIINGIFSPLTIVDNQRRLAEAYREWQQLAGDWTQSFPLDHDVTIRIRENGHGSLSIMNVHGFPFLDSSGTTLELRPNEGAIAVSQTHTLSLYPGDGQLILEVFHLPLRSVRSPLSFIFTPISRSEQGAADRPLNASAVR